MIEGRSTTRSFVLQLSEQAESVKTEGEASPKRGSERQAAGRAKSRVVLVAGDKKQAAPAIDVAEETPFCDEPRLGVPVMVPRTDRCH
ncbi:MAG: hypothetical protein MZV65_32915 [Chromatiales bacterium]|nr:hypothetical protein [Chromatiales bacterium]